MVGYGETMRKGAACAPVLFPLTSAKNAESWLSEPANSRAVVPCAGAVCEWRQLYRNVEVEFLTHPRALVRVFRGRTRFCECVELLLKLQSLQH